MSHSSLIESLLGYVSRIIHYVSSVFSYTEIHSFINLSMTIIIGLFGIYFAFVVIRYQIEYNSYGEILSREYLKRTKYLRLPIIGVILLFLLLSSSLFVKSFSPLAYTIYAFLVFISMIGFVCFFFFVLSKFTNSQSRIDFIRECYKGILYEECTDSDYVSQSEEKFNDVLRVSISNNNNVFIRESIISLEKYYLELIKAKVVFKISKILRIVGIIIHECIKSKNYSYLFPTLNFYQKLIDGEIFKKQNESNAIEVTSSYLRCLTASYSKEYIAYLRHNFSENHRKIRQSKCYSLFVFDFYIFLEEEDQFPKDEYKILMGMIISQYLQDIESSTDFNPDAFMKDFESFVNNVPMIESLYFGSIGLTSIIQSVKRNQESLFVNVARCLIRRFLREIQDNGASLGYKNCKILLDIIVDIQFRVSQNLIKKRETVQIKGLLVKFLTKYLDIVSGDKKSLEEFMSNDRVKICSMNYGFGSDYKKWIEELKEKLPSYINA